MPCNLHGDLDVGLWTSASTGRVGQYCRVCRRERAKNYNKRKANASGSHTKKQFEQKLKEFDSCPICKRNWDIIPKRPDKRYKFVWTEDHIVPLNQGGTDDIGNIQPLCYQCNFGKR